MANSNPVASDEAKSLADRVGQSLENLVITTKPVVICGVQRKVNTGDYENVDIYCGLALPVDMHAGMDADEITEAIQAAVRLGFEITSSETLIRYEVVRGTRVRS